jgi:hypothetical protein
VFSANIVGYVNKPIGPHFNACANPLDANISNSATNVLPNTGAVLDGSAVLTWNGLVFATKYIDSTSPTGFTDSSANPIPAPVLNPGVGFLFDNQAGLTNLTFVGSVEGVSSGSISNYMSLSVPPNVFNNLVASITPLGGGLVSSLQLTNVAGARDGDVIQLPNISGGGNLQAYTVRYFDSSSGTGFTDSSSNPTPEPQVPVGSYFIYQGQSTSPAWVQKIP